MSPNEKGAKEPFYFKFNTADWLTGTSGLSAAERGVYITLLALIYDNDGPIVRDDGRLARKCGLPTMPFTRALDGLVGEGKIYIDGNGLLDNYRANQEIATRQNRGVAKASAGSLGGKKTQEKQRAKSSKHQADANIVIANSLDISTNVDIAASPKPKRAKPKSKITEDAQPGDRDRQAAADAELHGDAFRAEWRRFRDYHISRGSLMADWSAAWRTWLGNRDKFSARASPNSPKRLNGNDLIGNLYWSLNDDEPADRNDEGIIDATFQAIA
jgi:uncharacterized protein YdaU (DUF1376 family)